MTITKLLIASAIIAISQTAFAAEHQQGEQLYKVYCDACHGMSGGMDMSKRVAPPIAAVRMHYIGYYRDEDSFVNAVSGWVEKQDPNRSLMRGAIRRFNLMPPVAIKNEDARKIARYIYAGNLQKPAGMEEHVLQQHKKAGMN
ncbi:MAG: cytochrome c [Gammaproteobacteria bacterium]|nr:cytochrome c [Gammaproteobacteria bacterium]